MAPAGVVQWRMRRVTARGQPANAMVGVLPGGAAFSAAWAFRQLPLRGVEQVVAAALLVVSGAFAALSLFVFPSAGAFTAG